MRISLTKSKGKGKDKWDVTVDGEIVGKTLTRKEADALARKIAT